MSNGLETGSVSVVPTSHDTAHLLSKKQSADLVGPLIANLSLEFSLRKGYRYSLVLTEADMVGAIPSTAFFSLRVGTGMIHFKCQTVTLKEENAICVFEILLYKLVTR